MAKNSVKSYDSSNNRKRTLNGKNKSSYLSNKNKNDKKKSNKDNSLENTTRIRIDDGRINDAESLDTSFLEGRLEKKSKDNIKTKERILKERKQIFFNFEIIKCVFFGLAFICLVVLGVVYLRDSKLFKIDTNPIINKQKDKDKEVINNEKVVDKNYLFVGDFYIDKYKFDDLEYYYVKSSKDDLTTGKLLDDMKKMVYDFNPSVIFIQLGFNDLKEDKSIDEIVDNYKKIINNIKDNRPYAKIVINSLLPINDEKDDFDSDRVSGSYADDVIKLNKKLNDLCSDEKIDYLDLYDLLSDDDKLNGDYTDNGIDLNDEGYNKIFDKINEYLE